MALFKGSNYDAARLEFDRTLTLDPGQIDAYVNKGLILMRGGEYSKAVGVFQAAIARDPNHALAHYNLGLAYEESEHFDQAIDVDAMFMRLGGAEHGELATYVGRRIEWLETLPGSRYGGSQR